MITANEAALETIKQYSRIQKENERLRKWVVRKIEKAVLRSIKQGSAFATIKVDTFSKEEEDYLFRLGYEWISASHDRKECTITWYKKLPEKKE